MYDDLERNGKETTLTYFKVISALTCHDYKKITKYISWDSWCPNQYLNQMPPKYKSGTLLPQPA